MFGQRQPIRSVIRSQEKINVPDFLRNNNKDKK